MSTDVHIVAMAAHTPVGLRADTSAAAVRAGISRVQEHAFMVDAAGHPLLYAAIPGLEPDIFGADRLMQLVKQALGSLLGTLAGAARLDFGLPCWVALPSPRPGLADRELAALEQNLARAPWPSLSPGGSLQLKALTHGHAGFAAALETAISVLSRGQSDVCLVGGADTYLNADTLDWLDAERRLFRADARGGFSPGEAGVVLALANEHARSRLQLPSLGRVVAVACTTEQASEASDEGLQGRALTEAYERLGAHLPQGGRFDDVYVDINDERARTTDYAFALLRCARLFRDGSQYTTTIGQTGELGAASAPFMVAMACEAFRRGYARGDSTLVSSASWSGLRGAVLLGRPRG